MRDWKTIVRERLTALNLTVAAESDLTDELAQHLEDRYHDLLSGGASEEEAYQNALSELDDMESLKARVERNERLPKHVPARGGDARKGNYLEDLLRDVRYAVRTMRNSPVFVLFVVLTLALGIGANTTVFTIINTLILNPLPVRNPAELEAVAFTDSKTISKAATSFPLSYTDLKDYQERNEVFRSLAGYTTPRAVTWQAGRASERMFAELVTSNYFSTLELTPVKGRFFLPEESAKPGTHAVAVMNYGTWQSRFGGAENIVDKTVRLNGIVFTVVGVAPRGFIGVNAIFGPDLWIPSAMVERFLPNEMQNALSDRGKAIFQGVGHLRRGVTEAQAQANMATIAAALAREFPATNEGHTAMVRPIREALFGSSMGMSNQILFASAALLAVVGIVLLIACSNVANLLLARAAARQQELAIRVAMGASRPRLVRQLLTESLILGSLSGALGMFLGYGGLQLLFGTLPGAANFVTPKLDGTVFLFALFISLATGFVFGTIPAMKASRTSVEEALKQQARTTGGSHRRVTIANALLVGQVAFSFLLLVTAALFLRSLRQAYDMDPGFQTTHLAVLMTSPGQASYGKAQAKAFYKEVRERVARLPGVESVSWSSNLPLWARSVNGLEVEGRQQRSRSDKIRAIVNIVDLEYFKTAGVAIKSGREFTGLDRENSLPVTIVNEKLANDYWSSGVTGSRALGKRIRLPGEERMREIVGVARNGNYSTWGEAPQLCVYVPLEQDFSDSMTLYVRSKGSPQQILLPIQHEVRTVGPAILAIDIRTGSQIVDGGLFQEKVGVGMLSVFGLLALGLASIGLYGILAYAVNHRKREIGLRMALGATQASVLKLILKEGMSLVISGMLIGFAAALLVGRLLTGILYGVGAGDPVSVGAAAIVLSAIALVACYVPARWASRVDPLVALREG
jgi:predicted permease